MRNIPTNLRCPRCLGKNFEISDVQSMELDTLFRCVKCGMDGTSEWLKDRTPKGCITVVEDRGKQ